MARGHKTVQFVMDGKYSSAICIMCTVFTGFTEFYKHIQSLEIISIIYLATVCHIESSLPPKVLSASTIKIQDNVSLSLTLFRAELVLDRFE